MSHPVLLVIDVQERVFNAMDAERRDDMVRNLKTLAITAQRLALPLIVTEQYPKGFGHTLPEIRALFEGVAPFEKTAFSCCGAGGFLDRLRATGGDQVIMARIKSRACVLLTALDCLRGGGAVTIAADAVCSRTRANHELGLEQARQARAVVSATETVVFQLLGRADTDVFREIAKLLR